MLEFDSRRFIDISNVNTRIPPMFMNMTYYEVGKLAFDLLPILLSRIDRGPAVSQLHNILLYSPPFHLIKDDPLGLEKVKVTQAIKEFLKV